MGHLNTNQSGNGRTVPAHQLPCNHDEYGGLHQTVARNTHSTLFTHIYEVTHIVTLQNLISQPRQIVDPKFVFAT